MIECLHFCFGLNYTSIWCFTLRLNITLFPIKRDVSEFFMVNSSTGYLYQIKRFDYEDTNIQCNLGKGGGFLNITAEVTLYVKYTGIFSYEKKNLTKIFILSEWIYIVLKMFKLCFHFKKIYAMCLKYSKLRGLKIQSLDLHLIIF